VVIILGNEDATNEDELFVCTSRVVTVWRALLGNLKLTKSAKVL